MISVSQHFAKFPETLSTTFIDRFARCLLEKLSPPPSFSVCAILLIAYLCRVSASAPTIAREYASKRITLYFLHTIRRVVTGLLPSAVVLEIRGSRFIHLFDNIGDYSADDPIFRAISIVATDDTTSSCDYLLDCSICRVASKIPIDSNYS